jgi:hypothetical protein
VLLHDPLAHRFAAALERASIVDVNLGEVFYKRSEKTGITPSDVGGVLHANGLEVIRLARADRGLSGP